MPFADVNGQRLHFEDTGGSGPPVVFSHGFLMDHEMFAPQVAALGATHRVITWDERGFGSTEYDGEPFTYWDSAADCLGLLTHLGIESAVLGGMSQGGFLSLRAALTAPDRVRALILLDSQAGVDDPDTAAANDAMNHVWLDQGPTDELAEIVAGIIIDDSGHSRSWITCPALVVHGTEDTAITMDRAELMATGLPGAGDVVRVAGAHAANLTNPEPVNAAITAFLAELAA